MKAVSASVSRHTDMFTISQSSPKTGTSVAFPESERSRHTNPSARSATAFTGSSPSTKSFNCVESSGNLSRAMFTCANSCSPRPVCVSTRVMAAR